MSIPTKPKGISFESLVDAGRKGNFEFVERCVKSYKLDLNTTLLSYERHSIILTHCTPLMLIVSSNNIDLTQQVCDCIVKTMVESGANLNIRNSAHLSALDLAIDADSTFYAKSCIKYGAIISHTFDNEKNPLMRAVTNGNIDIIRTLLTAKASVNIDSNSRKTELAVAVEKGRVDMIDALINAGADVNTLVQNNQTALSIACNLNNADLVRLLISHGANVNKRNGNDITSLHYCLMNSVNSRNTRVSQNTNDIVSMLIQAGANMNIAAKIRNTIKLKTPVCIACESRNLGLLELLVDNGADLWYLNRHGESILHIAMQIGYQDSLWEYILNKLQTLSGS